MLTKSQWSPASLLLAALGCRLTLTTKLRGWDAASNAALDDASMLLCVARSFELACNRHIGACMPLSCLCDSQQRAPLGWCWCVCSQCSMKWACMQLLSLAGPMLGKEHSAVAVAVFNCNSSHGCKCMQVLMPYTCQLFKLAWHSAFAIRPAVSPSNKPTYHHHTNVAWPATHKRMPQTITTELHKISQTYTLPLGLQAIPGLHTMLVTKCCCNKRCAKPGQVVVSFTTSFKAGSRC